MAQKANAEILFLFEDEIRAAARALARAVELNEHPEKTGSEDFGQICVNALKACYAAIQGADDPNSTLVLCSKNIFKPRE